MWAGREPRGRRLHERVADLSEVLACAGRPRQAASIPGGSLAKDRHAGHGGKFDDDFGHTHGRSEIEALVAGLQWIERKAVRSRARVLRGFDLDGARHAKRTYRQFPHAVRGVGHGEDTPYLRVCMGPLHRKIEDPSQPVHRLAEAGVGYRFVT